MLFKHKQKIDFKSIFDIGVETKVNPVPDPSFIQCPTIRIRNPGFTPQKKKN